jgi:hypothetical protein
VNPRLLPLLVCALAVISAPVHAQFTAAVVPPKAKAKVDTTARQDSVRHATAALAARVTDMKKWVDSAAGMPARPTSDSSSAVASVSDSATPALRDSVVLNRNARIRADSAASIATVEVHDSTGLKSDSAATPDRPRSHRARADRDSTRDSARATAGTTAPNTATALPLLALVAACTLLAGVALRRS